MADTLPNPETLTRQPGAPSAGGEVETIEFDEPISPEEALAEAKAQKEAAERERDVARSREQTLARERDEALSRETQASTRAVSAQEQAINTAIVSHTNIAEQAKQAITNAQAAGDSVALAEAFDQLADARAELKMLNNQRAYLEQQKNAPQPQHQTQQDGVTVRLPNGASMQASHEAKAWMDEHPRFYDDRPYFNHAVAAHEDIKADGIKEGTPAYFRALSERMQEFERYEAFKRGETPRDVPMNDTKPAPKAQPRMPASSMGAPVSRSPAPTSRSGVPDAATIAKKLGCEISDLRDFARINGFTAQRYGGDEAAAFNAYLKGHQEIGEIERVGGDTGMRVEGAWR